jgi:hypothetical protein
MRRLLTVFGVLVTVVATACLGSVAPPPPQAAIPYAVIYGRIGAPSLTLNIMVVIGAYVDSAAALRDSASGFAGSYQQGVDTDNTYMAVVQAKAPATYYLNVLANGQGRHGYEGSVDTIRALRVRFDSVGGGPHDSIEVDDSLP